MHARTGTRPRAQTRRSALPGLLLLALGLACPPAQAQLYTWKDEQGKTTIRNTPPPWYKESERPRGPRVQVLRNGKVVDDTAWPPAKRDESRAQGARQEEARVRAEATATAAAAGKKAADDD